jgi:hypothetical protein
MVTITKEEFALPAKISIDVTMFGDGDSVIPWFALTMFCANFVVWLWNLLVKANPAAPKRASGLQ